MITIEIKKSDETVFTDRKTSIKWESLRIRQALTKEVDTCSFAVEKIQSNDYKPEVEDEVVIKQDGIKIFAGYIVRVTETLGTDLVLNYDCECRDYTHDFDLKLVDKTYTDQTELEIITDIKDNFSTGDFTVDSVVGKNSLTITFNNVLPSEALQKLCEVFKKDWYIDYDRDIHYFSKETNLAPFSLSDNGGNYIPSSLQITRDITQIKNSVIVEGGEELSIDIFKDKWVANGQTPSFPTSYKYENYELTIDGVTKTVGIDGEDDFTAKDALYNKLNFTLRFNSSSPPADGSIIEFGGNYYFPISTRVREADSITSYRERQFQIIDPNIRDRDAARERAKAEILSYAAALQEGSFQTYTSGLRAGQKITIQSDLRNFTEDYLIGSLECSLYTPEKLIWTAGLVSVKTFDVMDLLAKIVDKSNIQIDPDALVKTAELVIKTIKVQRIITVVSPEHQAKNIQVIRSFLAQFNFPIKWVAGPYYPYSMSLDTKRVGLTDSGCLLGG